MTLWGSGIAYRFESQQTVSRLPWLYPKKSFLTGYPQCGYGEPTERLEDLLLVAKYIKAKGDIKIRINTNGLADLIWQKQTAPSLKGLIDTVSISLNTPNQEDYLKVVRPKFGAGSYDAMLRFAKDCTAYVPNVVMTVVDVVTSKEEQEQCRKICENIGARLRVRPFEE